MKRHKKNLISQILLSLLALFLLGGALSVSAFFYYAKDLPDPSSIVARRVSESTKIFDRTGNTVLYDIHGEEKRTVIPWEEIPETVKSATLASEDNAFYSHAGLDWRGIARALIKNLLSLGVAQGGSTISQQLVKNALLEQDRTLPRKIKEAVLTIEIERRFSKDQIFWMYLNQIPYGSNSYGIEAASQNFFGKPAKELNYAEAALLATLTKATSYYSPYGNHLDESLARKDSLLKRMLDLGRITEAQYDEAKNERLEFKPPRDNILAPHFVIMVRDYLIKKYGEETVTNGGLRVFTTLDYNLQKTAQEVVTKYGDINAKKYKANNAALVATDPKSGQIIAMVGSRDYFDIKNQGNFNVATAQRQPGSAFKPFAYAAAIGLGYPDTTVFFDYKTEFNPNCPPSGNGIKDQYGINCYNPQNYDGRYRGPVTMREALGQSLNLPSVKLLYLAGVDRVIDLATSMGITTLQANRKNFGLSLVLGGAEVKLVDIVSAYSVFANDGLREEASFLLRVEDANGNILEEYKPKEEQVLDPQVARMINNILSDNRARTPVFGPNSSLYFPGRPVAAKTGTTQENRDGWALGYTPALAVGIWTGNNDNTPMTREGAGVSAAGPMFHEFITRALASTPIENFIEPNPMTTDKIMLNGSYLQSTSNPDGTTNQQIHSILYYVDRNNPLGDAPSNPAGDSQFNNWEAAVQAGSSNLLFNQPPIQ
ncbi:MAG: hypothetical protein A3I32_02825 [Candidatus Yanofskybacteria bacterium RIFCSPLOWO2_02_FULL_45_10]|uniref:Uncharacterized protein n=2 Tax=Candidatus Yanofskyibacteriota TaxID=1752733 RepID=A0A1F8G0N6_9BACT|nr:MAG: hypothetical protein A3F25_02730 [Candidatus Yanofskybacteria bacterium RIFCSPHIGHO2_12_FULL_45_19b]OGN31584.1 MAG: hypothetical protein A3I32_02825 [Candidatus Yanofskybacteria bacterium RIFCSPLOWO2_02_FULL_45_10]